MGCISTGEDTLRKYAEALKTLSVPESVITSLRAKIRAQTVTWQLLMSGQSCRFKMTPAADLSAVYFMNNSMTSQLYIMVWFVDAVAGLCNDQRPFLPKVPALSPLWWTEMLESFFQFQKLEQTDASSDDQLNNHIVSPSKITTSIDLKWGNQCLDMSLLKNG